MLQRLEMGRTPLEARRPTGRTSSSISDRGSSAVRHNTARRRRAQTPRAGTAADEAIVMVGRACAPAVCLLLLAAAVAAFPQTAHANGRVVRLETLRAGPHEVSVGTVPGTPQIGVFHMTMTIADASTKAVLLDADVRITGVGPEGTENEIGPITATASSRDPSFYEANPSVDREGTWVFTIAVAVRIGGVVRGFRGRSPTGEPADRHRHLSRPGRVSRNHRPVGSRIPCGSGGPGPSGGDASARLRRGGALVIIGGGRL